MKAIWTKYIGPTNVRGSRIKASAEKGPYPATFSVTIDFPDELGSEDAHAKAALALCERMGWPGDLIGGGRPDGCGYLFVFADGLRYKNTVPSYAEQDAARKSAAAR